MFCNKYNINWRTIKTTDFVKENLTDVQIKGLGYKKRILFGKLKNYSGV